MTSRSVQVDTVLSDSLTLHEEKMYKTPKQNAKRKQTRTVMCSTEPVTEAPFVAAEWNALAIYFVKTPCELVCLLAILIALAKICLFVSNE